MSLPVYHRSNRTGAPVLTETAGSLNALLLACLVNGYNTQSVVSATASGGVVTFNFASGPGFEALDTVTIAGASNGAVNGQWRVQSASGNQVLVAIAGVPDGAVGGTITLKRSPLGWTRPYSGTNLGAYRQGGISSHKRYLRVYDGTMSSAARWYARGYEAMTDIDTGTGPYPTTGEVAGNGAEFIAPSSGASPRPWVLVGTPRNFYLICGYQSEASYAATPGEFLQMGDLGGFFFGDYARIRKPGDVYAQGIAAGVGFPQGGLYGSRAYTGASGSRPAVYLTGLNGSTGTCYGANYPDPASGGYDLSDSATVAENYGGVYAVRGNMPGMLCPWQSARFFGGLYPGHVFTGISGLTGRALLMTSHDLSSVYEYLLALDEDWGDA